MTTLTTEIPSEERVEAIMETVRFLYPNEQYPHDEETIRAMMVLGGSDAQIRESIAIAAINLRVDRESKTRYAAGVLRNLMNPRPRFYDDGPPEDSYGPDDDAYEYGDDQPERGRRWPFKRGQA